ncbi:polypeptide N-acetylgalactosaminyltransferase 9-like isoform 3-T3 [Salvelinus alpinus]
MSCDEEAAEMAEEERRHETERMRRKRGTIRGATTRILNQIDVEISQSNPDTDHLSTLLELLLAKENSLFELDGGIEQLTPLDGLEAEIACTEDYKERVIMLKSRAQRVIKKNQDLNPLPARVWQCGGSMEVLPCARVAHIERTKKPYNNDIDYYAKRNALRAAEVWMDDYKSHVYMAWNIPINNPGVDFGDVSERIALRKKLQCRSFQWYLQNVYPEMRVYNDTITYGEMRNSKASGYCLDQGPDHDNSPILYPCHGMTSQLARYTSAGLLQLGPLGSTTFLPNTKCLVDEGRGRTPSLNKCEGMSRSSQRLWDFTQNGPIISRDTGRCLEVEMSREASFGLRLVVQRCSGQRWTIRNWIKPPRH